MQCSAEQIFELIPDPMQHHSALRSASHTRIIELQPAANESEDLHIKISVADLALPLESYEALSYTWGGTSNSAKVIVSQTRAISVTKHLEDALRRFRLANRPRRLWIDALSINQNDDKEKGHQIPLMSTIFRGAATVLVWLGRDTQVEASLGRLSDLGRLILSDCWAVSAGLIIEIKKCVSSLINVRWFSRRWIIQEVVLNLDVVLIAGSKDLSFLKFMRIVKTLRRDGKTPSKQFVSILSLFDLWEIFNTQQEDENEHGRIRAPSTAKTERCNMLRLMRTFSHFGCADGRDHVFTIASLARDTSVLTSGKPHNRLKHLTNLGIPYELSVQEVYIRFAEFVSGSGRLHWILAQAAARTGRANDPTLPTWVPDWRVEELRRPFWTECHDITLGISARTRQILSNDEALNAPVDIGIGNVRYLGDNGETFLLDWGPTPPTIIRTGASIHQLKAALSCIQHWPDPPSDFSKSQDAYKWTAQLDSYEQLPTWRPMRPNNEFHFPLHVNWKSSGFEDPQSDEDVLGWIRAVFKDIVAHLIPHSPDLFNDLMDDDAFKRNTILSKLLEMLDYVITAGKMFMNHLALEEMWLITLTNAPTEDILRSILAGVQSINPLQIVYVRLIALTVRGRCLITCDIHLAKSAELDRLVLGLGPSHVEIGDRITCIHTLSMKQPSSHGHWSRTHLLRIVPQTTNAESERLLHATGKGDKSPTMKFVGDCFLTISRECWAYDYEGLQPQIPAWQLENESSGGWHKRASSITETTITLI